MKTFSTKSEIEDKNPRSLIPNTRSLHPENEKYRLLKLITSNKPITFS